MSNETRKAKRVIGVVLQSESGPYTVVVVTPAAFLGERRDFLWIGLELALGGEVVLAARLEEGLTFHGARTFVESALREPGSSFSWGHIALNDKVLSDLELEP